VSEGYKQHVEGDRYHKEIGFPENIEFPTGIMMLYSTKHAREEAENDRFGSYDLPTRQDLTQEMYERDPKEAIGDEDTKTKTHVFEITVQDGEVKFIAMRKHLDEERDKILVIEPDDEHTITTWSNMKTDEHENLNEDIYEEPRNEEAL